MFCEGILATDGREASGQKLGSGRMAKKEKREGQARKENSGEENICPCFNQDTLS